MKQPLLSLKVQTEQEEPIKKDTSWASPKFQLQTGQVKEPLLSLKMQTGWKEPTNKDTYWRLGFSCKQEN